MHTDTPNHNRPSISDNSTGTTNYDGVDSDLDLLMGNLTLEELGLPCGKAYNVVSGAGTEVTNDWYTLSFIYCSQTYFLARFRAGHATQVVPGACVRKI